MNIEELRARLKELEGTRKKMTDSWMTPATTEGVDGATETKDAEARDPSEAELTAFQKNVDEAKSLQAQLRAALEAEALDAGNADPAPVDKGAEGGTRTAPAAAAAPDLTAGERIAAHVWTQARMTHALRSGSVMTPETALKQIGLVPGQISRSLNTGIDADGGFLVPQDLAKEIIPLLRPRSVILKGNPRIVPLPHGSLDIPGGATGATAGYVGEGAQKPVSQGTFRKVSLKAKKLAGIVPVTQELLMFSDPSVLSFVEEDLREALVTTMDLNMLRSDGSGASPKGLRQIATDDSSTVDGTGIAADYAAINSFLGRMELRMTAANLPKVNQAWIMAPHVLTFLTDLLNAQGLPAYPSLQGESPTLRGKPVYDTTNVPVNLGVGSNETEIYLVEYSQIMIGDAMSLRMATSTEATVDTDGAGALINAFQDNLLLIRAEMMHDIGSRYVSAVVLGTGMTWGTDLV